MEFGKELFTELASKVEAFCVKNMVRICVIV